MATSASQTHTTHGLSYSLPAKAIRVLAIMLLIIGLVETFYSHHVRIGIIDLLLGAGFGIMGTTEALVVNKGWLWTWRIVEAACIVKAFALFLTKP